MRAAALRRLPQQSLLALVRCYRYLFKPWLGNVCRFEPSCSSYAMQALQQHGAVRGATLSAARLLRCHPWCAGGFDPVPGSGPNSAAGMFTRLLLEPKAAAARPPTRKPS